MEKSYVLNLRQNTYLSVGVAERFLELERRAFINIWYVSHVINLLMRGVLVR